jgi:hypothetical protein
LAIILCACSSPYEGDRINVAGIEFEGMAWRVDCATTTPESLYRKWLYNSPNYCDADLDPEKSYDMCPDWYVVRYRYEWAKKELRDRCAR